MAASDGVRVEITLRRATEPISGSVRVEHEPDVPFTGLLELITLLDGARGQDPGRTAVSCE